jgi:nicotinate-nucleotide adenylyltransferase
MIGILGGSFDPIHFGHLRSALEVADDLGMSCVHLVPSASPPHRESPRASAEQRLAMVAAAIEGEPRLVLDDREIKRGGTSYSFFTLEELRAEYPEEPLCLLLGSDAFQGLPGWHKWQQLTDFAHLVVMQRPGAEIPFTDELVTFLKDRHTRNLQDVQKEKAGRILFYEVTQMDISSSEIRNLISQGRNPRYFLPDAVLEIIRREGLYLS